MLVVTLMTFYISFSMVQCDSNNSIATVMDRVVLSSAPEPSSSPSPPLPPINLTLSMATIDLVTTKPQPETLSNIMNRNDEHHQLIPRTTASRLTDIVTATLSTIRYMMRRALLTYQFYHPEFEMGSCVVRYANRNYPQLMQAPLSSDKIYTVARSMLTSMTGYFTDMIDDHRVEVQAERQRIGTKIADITSSELDEFTTATTEPTVFVTPPSQAHEIQSPSAHLNLAQSFRVLPQPIQQPKPFQPQPLQYQHRRQFPQRFRSIRRSAAGSVLPNDNDYIDNESNDDHPVVSKNFIKLSRSIGSPFTSNEHRLLPKSSITRRNVDGTLMEPSLPDYQNYADNQLPFIDDHSARTTTYDNQILKNDNRPFLEVLTKTGLKVKPSDKIQVEELSLLYVADTLLPPSPLQPAGGALSLEVDQPPPLPVQTHLQHPELYLNYKTNQNDVDNAISNINIDDDDKEDGEGVVMAAEEDVNGTHGDAGNSDMVASGGDGAGILASLFDFENIILESLGLNNAKEVKSSSLTRCTQSYVMNIMWRMLESFVVAH